MGIDAQQTSILDIAIRYNVRDIMALRELTEDLGRQLENMVYLHLRRKHKEIYYFNEGGECDFVIKDRNQITMCVQVCYQLTNINLQSELNGMVNALKFFKLTSGTVCLYRLLADIIIKLQR